MITLDLNVKDLLTLNEIIINAAKQSDLPSIDNGRISELYVIFSDELKIALLLIGSPDIYNSLRDINLRDIQMNKLSELINLAVLSENDIDKKLNYQVVQMVIDRFKAA